MQPVKFSASELKDVKGELKFTKESCPDYLKPLIEECKPQAGYTSYTLQIGAYGREDKMYVAAQSGDDASGRSIVNFGARELFTFYKGKLREFIQTLGTGEVMFIEPDISKTVNAYVSATPRRSLDINGREVAHIRPKSYRRVTVVIDWIKKDEEVKKDEVKKSQEEDKKGPQGPTEPRA